MRLQKGRYDDWLADFEVCFCLPCRPFCARLVQWNEWEIRLEQHSVPVFMRTVCEIRKKIQTLAAHFVRDVLREIDAIEMSGLAATACTVNEPELFFDEQNRTVRWNGGAVKLCRKQFSFIKALWNGTKHSEQLDIIEEYVWQDRRTKKQPFVRRHAIFALASRTRKNVSNVDFPYKIDSVKNFSTLELQGYQLVLSAAHEISLQAQ